MFSQRVQACKVLPVVHMPLCTCIPCVASCTELYCVFIVLACALLWLTRLQLLDTCLSQRLQIGACWPCALPKSPFSCSYGSPGTGVMLKQQVCLGQDTFTAPSWPP